MRQSFACVVVCLCRLTAVSLVSFLCLHILQVELHLRNLGSVTGRRVPRWLEQRRRVCPNHGKDLKVTLLFFLFIIRILIVDILSIRDQRRIFLFCICVQEAVKQFFQAVQRFQLPQLQLSHQLPTLDPCCDLGKVPQVQLRQALHMAAIPIVAMVVLEEAVMGLCTAHRCTGIIVA